MSCVFRSDLFCQTPPIPEQYSTCSEPRYGTRASNEALSVHDDTYGAFMTLPPYTIQKKSASEQTGMHGDEQIHNRPCQSWLPPHAYLIAVRAALRLVGTVPTAHRFQGGPTA